MSESTTSRIQYWIDRLNAGDEQKAKEELLTICKNRLMELISIQIYRKAPHLKGREESVFQETMISALKRWDKLVGRTKDEIKPIQSPAHFFFRLGDLLHNALIDLLRKELRRAGRQRPLTTGTAEGSGIDPEDSQLSSQHLEKWLDLNEKVKSLEENLQQAVILLYYHGLTYAEAAGLLGITERQLRYRWIKAKLKLAELLSDYDPDSHGSKEEQ